MLIISPKEIPKKNQHEYAHKLLEACLASCGVSYSEESAVKKNEYGKPSLAEYPHIHYNVSHADGVTACIVADRECGIDAERVRPYRKNVVKRAFSEAEKAALENAAEEERDMLFFRLWTLKEAYVKAIGTGISYPLSTAEFSFENGRIVTNLSGCTFRQYIIRGNLVVSVCELTEKL